MSARRLELSGLAASRLNEKLFLSVRAAAGISQQLTAGGGAKRL